MRARGVRHASPGNGFWLYPLKLPFHAFLTTCFWFGKKFRWKSWATVSREKIQNGFYLGDFVTCTRYERPGDSFRIRESWHIWHTVFFFGIVSRKYRFMASPLCSFSAPVQCTTSCGLSSYWVEVVSLRDCTREPSRHCAYKLHGLSTDKALDSECKFLLVRAGDITAQVVQAIWVSQQPLCNKRNYKDLYGTQTVHYWS